MGILLYVLSEIKYLTCNLSITQEEIKRKTEGLVGNLALSVSFPYRACSAQLQFIRNFLLCPWIFPADPVNEVPSKSPQKAT